MLRALSCFVLLFMRILGCRLSLDVENELPFAHVLQSLFPSPCAVVEWQHVCSCAFGLADKVLLAHGTRSARPWPFDL